MKKFLLLGALFALSFSASAKPSLTDFPEKITSIAPACTEPQATVPACVSDVFATEAEVLQVRYTYEALPVVMTFPEMLATTLRCFPSPANSHVLPQVYGPPTSAFLARSSC